MVVRDPRAFYSYGLDPAQDVKSIGYDVLRHRISITYEAEAEEEAEEAIEAIRRQGQEIGEFYNVFVVDDEGCLRGTLPLRAMVTAAAGERAELLRDRARAAAADQFDALVPQAGEARCLRVVEGFMTV